MFRRPETSSIFLKIILLGDHGKDVAGEANRKDFSGEAASSIPLMQGFFSSISFLNFIAGESEFQFLHQFLSFVFRYVDKNFTPPLKPTINADFSPKEIQIEEKPVTLQIWDTPGRKRFHSPALPYYSGADGCILVYDINNKKSFEALEKWYSLFLDQVNPSDVSEPSRFPFLLLGNKIDADCGVMRQVSDKAAMDWCAAKGDIPYYETSAKEDCNIDAAFLTIAQIALASQNEKQTIYFSASSPVPVNEHEQRRLRGGWFCCNY